MEPELASPNPALTGSVPLGIGSLGWIARTLHRASYLATWALVAVIPMEGALQFEGVGRLSRVVGILAAAIWIAAVLVSGRVRRPAPFHVATVCFALWTCCSVLWSIDSELSLERSQTYLQLALLAMMLWDLCDTPAATRGMLQAYVLGATLTTLATLGSLLRNQAFYTGRFAAGGLHVDDLGLILALAVPVAWALAIIPRPNNRSQRCLQWLNFCLPAVILVGVCLTGTRAALVASLPTALFMVATLGRLHPGIRVVLLAAAAVTVFTLPLVVPERTLHRLGTIGEEITEGDLNGRFELWRQGLLSFTQHPWLGTGVYTHAVAIEAGKAAHNSLLSVLVELGLLGLALFAACLGCAVAATRRMPKWTAWFCLTWLAVWLLGAGTLSWEHRKPTWLVLSLVVALAATGFEEKKR